MRRTSRKTALAAAAAVALLAVPTAALADGGGGDADEGGLLLRSGVAGSTPTADGGPTLFGVAPGGLPWVTKKGDVKVRRDGRFELAVRGLVIPVAPFNGTNPIASVQATVYCNGKAAASTPAFPLSTAGDGKVKAMLMLPMTCVAPVVLVGPAGNTAVYIAANG